MSVHAPHGMDEKQLDDNEDNLECKDNMMIKAKQHEEGAVAHLR